MASAAGDESLGAGGTTLPGGDENNPSSHSSATWWWTASRTVLIGAVLFGLAARWIRRQMPFFASSAGKPPIFREDVLESRSDDDDTVEVDEEKRSAVLKQGFAPGKVPQNLDAIFIGSGIGSLSTAVLLSRAGKRVLVLEQHDRAGGCCHTFVEKGYEFDTGIHYIGGQGKMDSDRVMMDQLTGGRLKWDKLDDVYDVTRIGKGKDRKEFNVRSGSQEIWENELIKQFPEEKEAIKKFAAACVSVHKSFMPGIIVKLLPYWLAKLLLKTGIISMLSGYDRWNKTTVRQFVHGLTKNKDLRVMFQYLSGDYGTEPERASFSILGLVHKHYWRGAYYPRGGASEMPYHMIKEIQKSGGAVLVRANVAAIILDEGRNRAIGVKVQKGSSTVDIMAPMVVSGAGFTNTLERLLPSDVALRLNIVKDAKQKVIPSGSCFQAFFGFDAGSGADEVKVPQHNTWCYGSNEDMGTVIRRYMNLSREEALDCDPPMVFIGFPSAKDSTYMKRHPGKIACTIITFTNYQWFREWAGTSVSKRGDEYEGVKNSIGQRLLDIVFENFPQLEGKLEYAEYGTGLTTNHYLGTKDGETYGLDHDAERFSLDAQAALRPDFGIEGLYLTGQDVVSAGFAGALTAGVLTASKILGRNLFDECHRFRKYLQSKQAEQNCKKVD